MIRRLLLTTFVCTLFFCNVQGQTFGDNPSFRDRLFVGGGFGASFGDVSFVSVSPVLGYMVTPRLSAGVGAMYQYVSDTRFDPAFNRHDWGLNVFTRFLVVPPLFLHAEYEYLNYEFPDGRDGFGSFLAGGGLAQPLSRNVSLIAMALYNFSYVSDPTVRQPYADPWIIRFGFTAGF